MSPTRKENSTLPLTPQGCRGTHMGITPLLLILSLSSVWLSQKSLFFLKTLMNSTTYSRQEIYGEGVLNHEPGPSPRSRGQSCLPTCFKTLTLTLSTEQCLLFVCLPWRPASGQHMKGGVSVIPGQPNRACAFPTPKQLGTGGEALMLCCGLILTALQYPNECGFLIQSRETVTILK